MLNLKDKGVAVPNRIVREKKDLPNTATTSVASKVGPATLSVPLPDGRAMELALVDAALSPVTTNAFTAWQYARNAFVNLQVGDTIAAMREKTEAVVRGDLSHVEATLTAQAVALNAMFTELARRAVLNMGEHLGPTETYLRLAFKAQSQCRSTIEALAEIKNPRPVAFVRQANIANGPQQVNNGQPTTVATPRAEDSAIPAIEQSGDGHELSTHSATPALTSATDSRLAPVGEINRATHAGRQSQKRAQ